MGFDDLDAIYKGMVRAFIFAGAFSAFFVDPSFKRWLKQAATLSVAPAVILTFYFVGAISERPPPTSSSLTPGHAGDSWLAFMGVVAVFAVGYAGSFTMGYTLGLLLRGLGWLYRRIFPIRG